MYGTAIGKPSPPHIRAVLRNSDGLLMAFSSKHVGCMESSEAEVVAMLEALWIFSYSFHSKLLVESDSLTAISWVSSCYAHLDVSILFYFYFYFNGFQFYFIEIKELSSFVFVDFHHVECAANGFAGSLAKGWTDLFLFLLLPCTFCFLFVVCF